MSLRPACFTQKDPGSKTNKLKKNGSRGNSVSDSQKSCESRNKKPEIPLFSASENI